MKLHALCAAALVALPAAAHATDVIGNVNVDTTWTLASSPYRLTGDVTVAAHATLTIEPGVVIEAASSDGLGAGNDTNRVELTILGALVADGTAASPITFAGDVATPGSWHGIVIEVGADPSSITHASISHAAYGVRSRSTSALALENLVIEDGLVGIDLGDDGSSGASRSVSDAFFRRNRDTALRLQTRVDATISRCEFASNLGNGVQVGAGARATIDASRMMMNELAGVLVEADGELTMRNSVAAGNGTAGVDASQSAGKSITLINNTLDRNRKDPFWARGTGTGLYVRAVASAAAFVVRNNLITSSANGVEVLGGTCPSMDHNNVWGNGSNYVGCTAGAGSVSTNPLYVQPLALSGSWTAVSHSINFGYNSGTDTIVHPGAAAIRITGANFYVDSSYYNALTVGDRAGAVFTYVSSRTGTLQIGAGPTHTITFDRATSYSNYGRYSSTGYEWIGYAYNYRLQSSSPVLDVGSSIDIPTTDADGQVRSYDGDVDGTARPDLGAYEWHENLDPIARAGADATVLPNTAVSFDGSASYDADGSITAWEWDFGDGSPAAGGETATHTYAALGTYTVQLTVTDDQGVTGTDTATIVVSNNLPPTAAAGTDQYVAPGERVTLDASASADPDGNVIDYAWSFGDGTPDGSGRVVTHFYGSAGVYLATLTVTDDRGATATDQVAIVVGDVGGGDNLAPVAIAGGPYAADVGAEVELDGSASLDADGTIASWTWDFGDGSTGSGETVAHAYAAAGTYLVRLTVTDDRGATATDAAAVVIGSAGNLLPVAVASSDSSAWLGVPMRLDGSGSFDPDGTIVSWSWDFGDGESDLGEVVEHAWREPGIWIVTLTVTDDAGGTAKDYAAVRIGGGQDDNIEPVATFSGLGDTDAGERVLLDGSASSDEDGEIIAWQWDFGDGGSGSGPNVSHVWQAGGSYVVTLTVIDDAGARATATTGVEVNALPVADAGPARTALVGEALEFDASGSSDPDGEVASFAWDFGDGAKAEGATASHAFGQPGFYNVRLEVKDDRGAAGEAMALVLVTEKPKAPAAASEDGGCSSGGGAASLSALAFVAASLRRRRR